MRAKSLSILLGLTLLAASGARAATCNGLTCTIEGTSGNDTLIGTPGNDVICGLQGHDTIYAGGGDDTICGGLGDDDLHGESGADLILCEPGTDTIDGGVASDTVKLTAAAVANLSAVPPNVNDGVEVDILAFIENLTGSSGADTLIGDAGNNRLDGQNSADILTGGDGNDVLIGRIGDDTLDGGNGSDVLSGVDGNDILTGGSGADTLDGGTGSDTAAYTTAISVSLTTGTASDGDTLTAIENLQGSTGGDFLEGNGSANILQGGAGSDFLDGLGGTDTCNGGPHPPLGGGDGCANCETATSCEF